MAVLAFKSIIDFYPTVGFLFRLGSYSVTPPRIFSIFCIIVSVTEAFLQYFLPETPQCLILLVHANSKGTDFNEFKEKSAIS